jgi:TatD DNase family protein
VQGGTYPEDWERQKELARQIGPAIIPVFGAHPWWVSGWSDEEIDRVLEKLESELSWTEAPKGVGELGLDKHPGHVKAGDESVSLRQERAFTKQLELARAFRKPVVLHIVSAHAEALAILEKFGPFPPGGLVHSFSSSPEVARSYLDLGLTISLGGSVTRRGSQSLRKAIECVPPDRLVVETDCPDQLPELPGLKKGQMNEPVNLLGIAEVVAGIRGEDRDELLFRSAGNLKRIFR